MKTWYNYVLEILMFVHICQYIPNYHAHSRLLLTLTEYLFIWISSVYRTTHSVNQTLSVLTPSKHWALARAVCYSKTWAGVDSCRTVSLHEFTFSCPHSKNSAVYSCTFLFLLFILLPFLWMFPWNFPFLFRSDVFKMLLFFTIKVKFLNLCQMECDTNVKRNPQNDFYLY